MLFNSYSFLVLFLPAVLGICLLLSRRGQHKAALCWLLLASLVFYVWSASALLWLLCCSIILNFCFGKFLCSNKKTISKRAVLVCALAVNFSLLIYFKYALFFINTFAWIVKTEISFQGIALPLAVSYFTFQQIMYLVDAYRGTAPRYSLLHYALFVTFFPQLAQGPFVRHYEIIPQFQNKKILRLSYENLSVGLTILAIGLFKKVIIADGLAGPVNSIFEASKSGEPVSFFVAWCGALGYTFQLYFDFSGYSDAAIGIARLFGLRLPMNFFSPYKALNISDFWRRWHMTLSRFLRDYLYIPLGGNRRGAARKYYNLMVTMILCGLWHGAGFTFVVWGALHGIYIVVNNAWRSLRKSLGHDMKRQTLRGRILSGAATFLAVVFAWVIFRAENFSSAFNIIRGMLGLNGCVFPEELISAFMPFRLVCRLLNLQIGSTGGLIAAELVGYLSVSMLLVWLAPNTQEFMRDFNPTHDTFSTGAGPSRGWPAWRPSWLWAAVFSIMMIVSVINFTDVSYYIYLQF